MEVASLIILLLYHLDLVCIVYSLFWYPQEFLFLFLFFVKRFCLIFVLTWCIYYTWSYIFQIEHAVIFHFTYRSTIKASIILLPLLGLTWLFGLLAVNQQTSFLAWLFVILNASQVNNTHIHVDVFTAIWW